MFKEPYRLLFPLGTLFLLAGSLVWLPQLWSPGDYPVLMHRYLMVNGFVGCFIGGFLMTAVPKFSQTSSARPWEPLLFLMIIAIGLAFAYAQMEKIAFLFSALQALTLLVFLFPRMLKRKMNPPYSFVFVFSGLLMWFLSGLGIFLTDWEEFHALHFEGAIGSIILGVGSRLIPGILGHVEVVQAQRKIYESPESLLKVIPLHFYFLMFAFIGSYFLNDYPGSILRALIFCVIGFFYWRIWQMPKDKSALTRCLWLCGWLIVVSFALKASWQEGYIHASHAFFIAGIVLLCLLIAIRVLQSHGPQDKRIENKKVIYVVTSLVVLAASTRVSAILMPDHYLSHLGYSSLVLVTAILLWSYHFLRYSLMVSPR
jgi:uncharacterized protein involved in response to NO